jgi:hypothetical protein
MATNDDELWKRLGWAKAPDLSSLEELMKVRRELADRPVTDAAAAAHSLIPRLLDIDVGSFNNMCVEDICHRMCSSTFNFLVATKTAILLPM